MEAKKTERPAFLESLLAEADNFDSSLFAPTRGFERKSGEAEIGEIAGWTRQVFALSRYYGREKERLAVELSYDDSNETIRRCGEMQSKSLLLKMVFWFLVNSQFETWNEGIGIRQNWMIVKAVSDPREQLGKFLEGLLGS